MITEEQAKTLKVGVLVHNSFISHQGLCELWRVKVPYAVAPIGWIVVLERVGSPNSSAGICEARMEEWHLPEECPYKAKLKPATIEEVEAMLKRNLLGLVDEALAEFIAACQEALKERDEHRNQH